MSVPVDVFYWKTQPAALRAEVDWNFATWIPMFLHALADEAEDALALLQSLERGWSAARRATTGHRRSSRTPAAVDLLAAQRVDGLRAEDWLAGSSQ
ncbi:hypothetical protein [Falsiroseomonas sp. E2-1-a20]|uniref:hypothetical protein n=1 Tax=Falsiroseomonas sp. E2-1-a20 TaxID=3239300 RepID=UPI003F3294C5